MRIKKKEIQSEIFTGSMADISFLLIIYFMITSAFSADRGLDFALPEDTDTPEIKQEDSIDVHVLRGGAIEVDAKGLPLEGLLPYVLEKLKQKRPGTSGRTSTAGPCIWTSAENR
jgi:biopolymer transport protein ExbD